MNKGLAIALILLTLVVTLLCANTALVVDAVAENTAVIKALNETHPPSVSELSHARAVFEESRFLLSISVPLGYLDEYERNLRYMESAILTQNEGHYAQARMGALTALEQIKKATVFSPEQLF